MSDGQLAMRPETAASVRAQIFHHFDWVLGLENPHPIGDVRNVLAQYQDARQRTLLGNYDALLTVEHDMVLPRDAIKRLWGTVSDIVYGVYRLRHGSKSVNVWEYTGGRNPGGSLSDHPARLEAARRRGVARVSGVGFGCTLIRRRVLEAFNFRPGNGHDCPDIPFAEDTNRAGFVSVARFDVACGHYDGDKVLWPYGDAGMNTVKVTARQNVVAAGVRMEAGQQYTLDSDEATELARAGFVEVEQAATPEAATMTAPETATKVQVKRRVKGQ